MAINERIVDCVAGVVVTFIYFTCNWYMFVITLITIVIIFLYMRHNYQPSVEPYSYRSHSVSRHQRHLQSTPQLSSISSVSFLSNTSRFDSMQRDSLLRNRSILTPRNDHNDTRSTQVSASPQRANFRFPMKRITPESFLGNIPKVSFKKYQPIVRSTKPTTVTISTFGSSAFDFKPSVKLDNLLANSRHKEPIFNTPIQQTDSRPLIEQYQANFPEPVMMIDASPQQQQSETQGRKRPQVDSEEESETYQMSKIKRTKKVFSAYMATKAQAGTIATSADNHGANDWYLRPSTSATQPMNKPVAVTTSSLNRRTQRLNTKTLRAKLTASKFNEISSSYSSLGGSLMTTAPGQKRRKPRDSPEKLSKIPRSRVEIAESEPNKGVNSTSSTTEIVEARPSLESMVDVTMETNDGSKDSSRDTSKENDQMKSNTIKTINSLVDTIGNDAKEKTVTANDEKRPNEFDLTVDEPFKEDNDAKKESYLHTIEEHGRDEKRQRKRLGHFMKALSSIDTS